MGVRQNQDWKIANPTYRSFSFKMKLQTGSPFICANSLSYALGYKIVAQVICILLTLSFRLSLYEKDKFSLKMALQAGTPIILAEYYFYT